MYWGPGRDCKYSGAKRGIGASGCIGVPRGCRGMLGGIRGCQVVYRC